MRSAPSSVQMHNQTFTVDATTLAPGTNWDCSVTFTGLLGNDHTETEHVVTWSGAASDDVVRSYDHAALGATGGADTVMIHIGATGAGHSFGAAPFHSMHGCYGDDRCRLIGAAIEVTNTTAEIYQQGAVTTAMLPDIAKDTGTVTYLDVNVAPWLGIEAQADTLPTFASYVEDLRRVPTSQTWKAKDGVYAVPRLVAPDLVVGDPDTLERTVIIHDTAPALGAPGYSIRPHAKTVIGPIEKPMISCPMVSGFSPLQIFFTGLSPETTLSVSLRTIVEYFPAVNSVLLPTSMPSPPFDPLSLALYSAAVQRAPYAVPVDFNAAGDYFRMVLKAIEAVAPMIGGLTGPYAPIFNVAGSAAGALAKIDYSKINVKRDANKLLRQVRQKVSRKSAGRSAIPSRH